MDGVHRRGGGHLRSILPYSYRHEYHNGTAIPIHDKITITNERKMDSSEAG